MNVQIPDGVPLPCLDAERSLIGAILLEPRQFHANRSMVKAQDFHDPRLAKIYRAFCRLNSFGIEIDAVRVLNQLEITGEIDEVGGAPFLAQLVEDVPSSDGARDYATIVAERSMAR